MSTLFHLFLRFPSVASTPPFSSLQTCEGGESGTGVMSQGLTVATRQHHRAVKKSKAEMIPESHGGPRAARKKDGFVIRVVLYTYVHIIRAYVGAL